MEISDRPDTEAPQRMLDAQDCDLVAGAYGYSRLGEWAFGGMTTDLLLAPDRCTLVSH